MTTISHLLIQTKKPTLTTNPRQPAAIKSPPPMRPRPSADFHMRRFAVPWRHSASHMRQIESYGMGAGNKRATDAVCSAQAHFRPLHPPLLHLRERAADACLGSAKQQQSKQTFLVARR